MDVDGEEAAMDAETEATLLREVTTLLMLSAMLDLRGATSGRVEA